MIIKLHNVAIDKLYNLVMAGFGNGRILLLLGSTILYGHSRALVYCLDTVSFGTD